MARHRPRGATHVPGKQTLFLHPSPAIVTRHHHAVKTFLLSLPYLVIVVLIIRAQGSFDVFTVWNCFPVAVAFGALVGGLRFRGPRAAAFIAFSVIAALLPALFHLAWLFDWGGTATGSSTSALAFIFVPFWVGILAAVAAAIAWCVARFFHRPAIARPE